MEDKNLVLGFEETSAMQIKTLLRQMAECVALSEASQDKMLAWKNEIESLLESNHQLLKLQLHEVQSATEELKENLTAAGAARSRIMIDKLSKISESQLNKLSELSHHFEKQAQDSFSRFDKASTFTIKNLTEAFNAFNPEDLKHFFKTSQSQIEKLGHFTAKRILNIMKWLYWKSVFISVTSCLLTVLVVCFYINDEWPWELHATAKFQRSAGQALINAWPHLSDAEKKHIDLFKN